AGHGIGSGPPRHTEPRPKMITGAASCAFTDTDHAVSHPLAFVVLRRVILTPVTTAVGTSGSAITQRVHSLNRPNMVSVGTIIWLSSELMFFAGLFAMYFVARAQAPDGIWPPPPTELNLALAVPVTTVLVASSFTCQMGVFAAERGDVFGLRRWYVL